MGFFCVLSKPAERPVRQAKARSMALVDEIQSLRRPILSTMVAPVVEATRFQIARPPLMSVCSFGSVTPMRRSTGACNGHD